MTDEQRAMLRDIRQRTGQLMDSLRASRDAPGETERARYRYPLVHIDQADIALFNAERYDNRRKGAR
jgi:hypothetical protein